MSAAPTRAVVAAYALPAIPLAAMYFPVFVFVAEFYAANRGVSLALAGTIFLAVRVFDAVSDPAIGFLSDRWQTRYGRRRPWLALSAPLVMLAAWQLFVPPESAGAAHMALWLFVLTFAWTLAMTPYFAWGAELAVGYDDRARVTVWREGLGLVGTIIAALLYGSAAGEAGMVRVAWMVVLILPIATMICLWYVPEPRDHSAKSPRIGGVFAILRTQPVFRRLLLAYLLNGFGNGIAATLFIFYATYRLDAPEMGGPLLVLYFAAAALGAPFWSWASARSSKHRVWCLAMIYAGLVFVWTIILGPGDWIWFAAICVASGAALGADLALPSAIQADLVDIATLETGSQQTGAFFAIWSVATKLALAVSGAAVFWILDATGFDVALGAAQDTTILALIYGLGPIALKFTAIALMWNFPLSRDGVAETRAQIGT